MAASTQSFIDIAALDSVAPHFAVGDAIVILTTDLAQVIWANGTGAAILGFSGIEAAIGADSGLSRSAMRQIEATPGFPEIGSDRAITVRLAAGLISQTTMFRASHLQLPGDEAAIMLVVPFTGASTRSSEEIARRAISGFEDPGNYLALIDARGRRLAATQGFEGLGMTDPDLARLAQDMSGHEDRVLKRIIRVGGYAIPVGLARLNSDPGLFLLITVDERQTASVAAETAAAIVDDSQPSVTPPLESSVPAPDQSPPESVDAVRDAETSTSAGDPTREPIDLAAAHGSDESSPSTAADAAFDAVLEGDRVEADAPPADDASIDETSLPDGATAEAEDATSSTHHDAWYFTQSSEERPAETRMPAAASQAGASDSVIPAAIDRTAAPVRFIWRTDASGRFTSISPEFVAAVGEAAADVVGKDFGEVSRRLALDPDGEIAALLDRRDTWSGRSVSWPIAGTALIVPVDLAALPAYDRERRFEGFRGFGVARLGDAVADPRETGLALAEKASAAAEGEIADQPRADPTADPFRGEVPALEVNPKPLERRYSDKVIRLAEHRAPANDRDPNDRDPKKKSPNGKELSPLERTAFREIGEHLKRTSGDSPSLEHLAQPEPVETSTAETNAGGEFGHAMAAADSDLSAAPADESEPAGRPTVEPGGLPSGDVQPDADAAENEASAPADVPPVVVLGEEKTLAEMDAADGNAATDAATAATDADASETRIAPDEAASSASAGEARNSLEAAAEPEGASPPEVRDAGDAVSVPPSIGANVGRDASADADAPAKAPADAPADEAAEPVQLRPSYTSRSLFDFVEREQATESNASPQQRLDKDPAISPALKQTGFLPSAFAERRADTSILAQLPIPVLVHSGDTLHYANDAFLQLTGYRDIDELASRGGLDALLSGPAADRPDGDNRVMLHRRDGSEILVSAFLQSVPWIGGKALLLTLTRQAAAAGDGGNAAREAELEARLAELRTILDTATDGVVLIDNSGTVRSISRPAEALFGYDGDQIVGRPFTALFAVESQRSAQDYLAGLTENGVASVLNDGREVIGREAQGRFIPLFMTIGRLPGNSGFCAVLRDITQWKRAEEDLTQARAQAERTSSQKSDFLARVSHEIRTPLNAIIGFSELMLDEKFGPITNDRYRDYLRDINRSGNHVLDLVNDLLDISKIEAGQQEMDYEAISLNDALNEAVAMMQPQANRERVIIRSSLASKLPEVVADLRSVKQIALNVLSNAIRYTQAGGQVIVSTAHEPNGEVVMRVRDTGIGMTQPEIEQALKPFKQLNALKRVRGDGTGLGLPLTKAMVEANRARFAIYSTPGEGTLVEVTFPSTRVLAG